METPCFTSPNPLKPIFYMAKHCVPETAFLSAIHCLHDTFMQ